MGATERERNQSGLTLMMPARKPKRRNKNYSLIVHYYKGLKREREREKKGEERELCKKLLAWTCRTNRQTRQARRARRQILIARPVSCFVCSTYTKTTTQVSAWIGKLKNYFLSGRKSPSKYQLLLYSPRQSFCFIFFGHYTFDLY